MSMSVLHPEHESLSALLDGELRGDAARFAGRRLEHDADWQARMARWQFMGAALRGQASLPAADDFASRVMQAVAADASPAPIAVMPGRKAGAGRRRVWASVALAASVAAAVMLVQPFGARGPASTPADVPLAAAPSPTVSAPAAVAPAASAMPAARQPDRAAVRVASAARSPRTPIRTRSTPRRTGEVRTAAEPVQAVAAASVRPFAVPAAAEVSARPWPRASLPALSGGSSLTASFEQAPSFYPFEPPADAPAATPAP